MMWCQCWCGEIFEFEPDEQIVICPHCLAFHDDLPPVPSGLDPEDDVSNA